MIGIQSNDFDKYNFYSQNNYKHKTGKSSKTQSSKIKTNNFVKA